MSAKMQPTTLEGLLVALQRKVMQIERRLTRIGSGGSPVGSTMPFFGMVAPPGWLLMQGQSVNRADEPDLFYTLNASQGAVTVSIATPGVVTKTAHGLTNGMRVWFETTGALPTGLSANTTYYVVNGAADTFQLSATLNGAAIATSGSQSGVHTLWASAAGVSSATTFLIPDARGRVLVGRDGGDEQFNSIGETGGEKNHTLTGPELPAHQHRLGHNYGGNLGYAENTGGPTQYTVGYGVTRGSSNDLKSGTQDTTTGQPHNNLQPFLVSHMIIKT